jgi:hypothetical protein
MEKRPGDVLDRSLPFLLDNATRAREASSFVLRPSSFVLRPSSFVLRPSSFISGPSFVGMLFLDGRSLLA